MFDPGPVFLALSRRYLEEDLLSRIRLAVRELSDADLWWRPNDVSNSVGNLLLHLAGNVRQWIVSAVGGEPDSRDRQAEFERKEPLAREELLALLEAAVRDAGAVLRDLPPSTLAEERVVQGRRVSVLEAVYHVVEHFSMHAGQILYVTKLRTGRDLGFYRVVGGVPEATWRREGERTS